jgi:DNA polymerase delta subunit 2
MCDQKYIIKRDKKQELLQYATLYFHRLEKLRPSVKDAAELKWKDFTNLKIQDNILDIKPKEETVIIGTLFKEQKLKPSILNNIMGVLG